MAVFAVGRFSISCCILSGSTLSFSFIFAHYLSFFFYFILFSLRKKERKEDRRKYYIFYKYKNRDRLWDTCTLQGAKVYVPRALTCGASHAQCASVIIGRVFGSEWAVFSLLRTTPKRPLFFFSFVSLPLLLLVSSFGVIIPYSFLFLSIHFIYFSFKFWMQPARSFFFGFRNSCFFFLFFNGSIAVLVVVVELLLLLRPTHQPTTSQPTIWPTTSISI